MACVPVNTKGIFFCVNVRIISFKSTGDAAIRELHSDRYCRCKKKLSCTASPWPTFRRAALAACHSGSLPKSSAGAFGRVRWRFFVESSFLILSPCVLARLWHGILAVGAGFHGSL